MGLINRLYQKGHDRGQSPVFGRPAGVMTMPLIIIEWLHIHHHHQLQYAHIAAILCIASVHLIKAGYCFQDKLSRFSGVGTFSGILYWQIYHVTGGADLGTGLPYNIICIHGFNLMPSLHINNNLNYFLKSNIVSLTGLISRHITSCLFPFLSQTLTRCISFKCLMRFARL